MRRRSGSSVSKQILNKMYSLWIVLSVAVVFAQAGHLGGQSVSNVGYTTHHIPSYQNYGGGFGGQAYSSAYSTISHHGGAYGGQFYRPEPEYYV